MSRSTASSSAGASSPQKNGSGRDRGAVRDRAGDAGARSTRGRTRLLVVEDDPHILLGLEEILKGEGFEVAVCNRGDRALDMLGAVAPDLLVLDVMLPGVSGYDLCRQIRAGALTLPILMLTAKGQEMDKVIGLELGADDYLTKPFGVRELVARIHALLRRVRAQAGTDAAGVGSAAARGARGATAVTSGPSEAGTIGGDCFNIGASVIDPRRFEVRRGEQVEPLTARELKLLQLFHRCSGEVLSRDRLLNEVWGHGYYGTTRTLDQVIVQLRRKLGDNGDQPRHLLTVHGVGYRLAGGE